MISDTNFSSETQAASVLNEVNEIPYASLRGLIEAFTEAPGTISSGFQNFM